MSTKIIAGNATNNGASFSGDTNGVLEIATGASQTTAITIDGSQNVTVNGTLVASNAAKAWVNFNGVTTASIRASYNVSSVTRNGSGYYTVSFATPLADANYSVIGSSTRLTNDTAASTDMNCINVIVSLTSSSFVIKTGYAGGVNTCEDSQYVRCAVFR